MSTVYMVMQYGNCTQDAIAAYTDEEVAGIVVSLCRAGMRGSFGIVEAELDLNVDDIRQGKTFFIVEITGNNIKATQAFPSEPNIIQDVNGATIFLYAFNAYLAEKEATEMYRKFKETGSW